MAETPLAEMLSLPPRALRGAMRDAPARLPWALAMAESTQDPRHHAEGDVWTHTCLVVESLLDGEGYRNAGEEGRRVLLAAALLHDIAKPATREEQPDGSVTNNGHSRLGAHMARELLWEEGWAPDLRERVCRLIAVHQVPFWLVERTEAGIERFVVAHSLISCNRDLLALATADAAGRRCANPQAREDLLTNVGLFGLAAAEAGCLDRPFGFLNAHSRMHFLHEDGTPHGQLFDTTAPGFTMTVMSGIPGSGKSSWVAREVATGGMLEGQEVISLDALRLTMGLPHEKNQGAVRQAATLRAKQLLAARQSFVWDAVNIDTLRRTPLLRLALDYGARVRMVAIEPPSRGQLFSRNRAREDSLPVAAIERLIRAWEPPAPTECHELVVVEANEPERSHRPGRTP